MIEAPIREFGVMLLCVLALTSCTSGEHLDTGSESSTAEQTPVQVEVDSVDKTETPAPVGPCDHDTVPAGVSLRLSPSDSLVVNIESVPNADELSIRVPIGNTFKVVSWSVSDSLPDNMQPSEMREVTQLTLKPAELQGKRWVAGSPTFEPVFSDYGVYMIKWGIGLSTDGPNMDFKKVLFCPSS